MVNKPSAPSAELAHAIAAGMPTCPICHGRNVRPSKSIGLRDNLLAIANYVPYRCRTCQHRFYKHPPRHVES